MINYMPPSRLPTAVQDLGFPCPRWWKMTTKINPSRQTQRFFLNRASKLGLSLTPSPWRCRRTTQTSGAPFCRRRRTRRWRCSGHGPAYRTEPPLLGLWWILDLAFMVGGDKEGRDDSLSFSLTFLGVQRLLVRARSIRALRRY